MPRLEISIGLAFRLSKIENFFKIFKFSKLTSIGWIADR